MLPRFVVIGAQKSATSSLCDLMGRHEGVFMCEPKEPYFFSRDEEWGRGVDWYESLFAGASSDQIAGEGTTECTQRTIYPHAAERLALTLPDARLVFMVRDPLDRIVSHYVHMQTAGGRETRPFNEAVMDGASFAYVENSMYSFQLEAIEERFSSDRVLVLFYEDFVSDPVGVANVALRFVGVDGGLSEETEAVRKNAWTQRRSDTAALRMLRRAPGFGSVASLAPRGLYRGVRSVLKRELSSKPDWDPAVRRAVAERLAEDSRALLDRFGRPRSMWSVEEALGAPAR